MLLSPTIWSSRRDEGGKFFDEVVTLLLSTFRLNSVIVVGLFQVVIEGRRGRTLATDLVAVRLEPMKRRRARHSTDVTRLGAVATSQTVQTVGCSRRVVARSLTEVSVVMVSLGGR